MRKNTLLLAGVALLALSACKKDLKTLLLKHRLRLRWKRLAIQWKPLAMLPVLRSSTQAMRSFTQVTRLLKPRVLRWKKLGMP